MLDAACRALGTPAPASDLRQRPRMMRGCPPLALLVELLSAPAS
jgi:hypothetical protein